MISPKIKEKVVMERLVAKKTIQDLVAEYGVSAGSISRWTNEYIRLHGRDTADLLSDTDGEIKRLRRENLALTKEIEKIKGEKATLESLILRILGY